MTGWEYFELPLPYPTTKIQSCDFGLLLSVLAPSLSFPEKEIRKYQLVLDTLVVPVDITFHCSDAEANDSIEIITIIDEERDHHELLRMDGPHALFITTRRKDNEAISKDSRKKPKTNETRFRFVKHSQAYTLCTRRAKQVAKHSQAAPYEHEEQNKP